MAIDRGRYFDKEPSTKPRPMSPPPRPAPLPKQQMELHFSDKWLRERIENDPDIECDAGPELTSEIISKLKTTMKERETTMDDNKEEVVIKEEVVSQSPDRKVFTVDTGNITDKGIVA